MVAIGRYVTEIERLDQDRKRPLTARSVLLSALLGEDPPRLAARRLVRLAGLFGINDNQARVALSRMARRGEVRADEDGTYALAGRHLQRAARLQSGRSASTGAYDGRWVVVVLPGGGESPARRKERRASLRAARLGELRESVWVRPANLAVELDASVAGTATRFSAVPAEDPGALAHRVFDLEGWARRARTLLATLAKDQAAHSLAAGFELDAEVLRHLQRDPLVPASLLAADWPGPELRDAYEAFHARYRERLAEAHRAVAR